MRGRIRGLAPLALLLTVLVFGCSRAPQNKLVGTYVGKPQLTAEGLALIEKKEGAKAEQAKAQISNTSINLELKPDMTFTMTTSGMTPSTVTGKWTDNGTKILLSNNASPGSSMLSLNVSADSKTLTPDTGDNTKGAPMETLTFTRSG